MELYKLIVLIGELLAERHGIAIACARVCGSTRKEGPAVTTRGEHRILGVNAMNGPVFHIQGHDADASTFLVHDQVKGEVLDKVSGIKGERASVERMQHGVSRTIRRRRTAIGLSAFAEMERLSTKGALIDLAIVRSRKGQTKGFQLQNRRGCFPTHVMNGVLVAEPITTFDGIVHMPAPIVFRHIAERGVDSSLCGDRMGARGKEFGDTRRFKAGFTQTHGRTEATSTRSDDDGVVGVIDDRVITDEATRDAAEHSMLGESHLIYSG
jgi:hypothetical protein